MDETNSFETPTALPESKVAMLSTVVSAVIGGLVSVVLGVVGVIALLLFYGKGMPGMVECLILAVLAFVFLVVPGVAIGAAIGALLNRGKRDS